MASTPIDLFRNGNASGPRMDRVKTNLTHPPGSYDIDVTVDSQGIQWVGANTGGISTADKVINTWKKVWKLDAGTTIPNELNVWNDDPSQGHWTWDPSYRMLLSDYVKALALMNGFFTRIK